MSVKFEAQLKIAESVQETKIRAWVSDLRASGFVGAHPDDGWVNRKNNEVVLQYPQFNDGITAGGKFALGCPGDWREVRVVSKRKSPFGITYWKFEEVK